jgi:hypothetical protein
MHCPRLLKSLSRLCLIACAFALLPAAARAQFDTATVLGTVRDQSGAALPKATVTLRNVDTGVTATAETDENGDYQFLNVKIGTYQVTAEAQGFARGLAENIQVVVNARQRVDLALKTGALSETVTVTADAVLLETESSERGQVINRQQIVNLP